jgi:hypothetical protein
MKRIAYVDHSYHKKTISTKFLPDILVEKGHTVDFFWDDKWKGGGAVSLSEVLDYDVVIMFQSYCSLGNEAFFSKVHPNVVYIPMLDQFGIWRGPISSQSDFWKPFQGSKVLNFSTAAHGMTVGMGIRSKLARFYRKPEVKNDIVGLHGFLWIRLQDEISWALVKKLIKNTKFDSFHLHIAKDPGSSDVKIPSQIDIDKYNISISTWFEKKEDFLNVLKKTNVFFAPRMEEGIGQSFLEAFSRGQCIVAPNNGTMNEYIQDGFTGLLFDWENPKPLDFSNVSDISKNAYDSCIAGYGKWLASQDDIVEFILMSNQEAYVSRYNYFLDNFADSKPSFHLEMKLRIKNKLKNIALARVIYRLLKKFKGKKTI